MRDDQMRMLSPTEVRRKLRKVIPPPGPEKYRGQVGLPEVKFAWDRSIAKTIDVRPGISISTLAEIYLQAGCLAPVEFREYDGTVHRVLQWTSEPFKRSGKYDHISHHMVETDQGVFEVTRHGDGIRTEEERTKCLWFIERRIEGGEEKNESSEMCGIPEPNSPWETLPQVCKQILVALANFAK